LPYTIQNYLAYEITNPRMNPEEHPEFKKTEDEVKAHITKLMSVNGNKSVDYYHRELGKIVWEYIGMSRNEKGLKEAIKLIKEIKKEFWANVHIPGNTDTVNPELEKANRVADFIEIAELMALDALNRNESCGGHLRTEYTTEEGEAMRRDDEYMYVSAWEYKGDDKDPQLNKEPLHYEEIEVKTRNYKTA
ncbi:MAG: fumarate reductase/succinate dehydrogenase flavoprotein subunit, partial [Bacteroidales bacterium]|nr:fumarate reductase/succinate dehydrogenase flavoprotein subunit [Bacteroidales bacterium]